MPKLTPPIGPEDHVIGPKKAPVTLVEYGDFECPYCGQAYPIVEAVRKEFSDKLLFAFRHFPLTEIHPHAEHAAEAAESAGAEGKFWEMHHMLFENQDALDDLALIQYAEALDLDLKTFTDALDYGTFRPKIQRDFMSGVRSGVNGTPTFFINGQRHDGSYEFADLVQAIERASREKAYV
jgi:protein-disulfide isomerase